MLLFVSRDLIIIRVVFRIKYVFIFTYFSLRSFVTIKCHLVLIVVFLFNLSSCLICCSYLICIPYLYFAHFNFVHIELFVFEYHVICLPRTHHVVYVYLSFFYIILFYFSLLFLSLSFSCPCTSPKWRPNSSPFPWILAHNYCLAVHPLMDLESQPISNPIPVHFEGPNIKFWVEAAAASSFPHLPCTIHVPLCIAQPKRLPTCIYPCKLFFFSFSHLPEATSLPLPTSHA